MRTMGFGFRVLSFVLLLMMVGCSGPQTTIRPEVITIPVPVIQIDTVYAVTPGVSIEEMNHHNRLVDSLLNELENRAVLIQEPYATNHPPVDWRRYHGEHVTERGDSLSVDFNLKRDPTFTNWRVVAMPVSTMDMDTTQSVIVQGTPFMSKVGIFFMGMLATVGLGALLRFKGIL